MSKTRCVDCKNEVDVPEGYKISTCLIYDHWFEPTLSLATNVTKLVVVEEEYESRGIIKINHKPSLKMHYYTRAARGEVSGFGKVRREGDDYIVTDVKIFKQICTSGHTELDKTALAQFIYWLSKRDEDPAEWNLWWHSHAGMSVFFSGTDEDTIQELSADTKLLSICINKRSDMVGRVDERGENQPLRVMCLPKREDKLWKECKREVERKVEDRKWKEVKNDSEEKEVAYSKDRSFCF